MNKLKEIRFLRGMSQFQLRIITGIHQSKISLIENGLVEPRDDEKEKFARVLKASVKILFPQEKKGRKFNGSTVLTRGRTA